MVDSGFALRLERIGVLLMLLCRYMHTQYQGRRRADMSIERCTDEPFQTLHEAFILELIMSPHPDLLPLEQ